MAALPHILVINGPNLNLLGQREPSIYGSATLADAEALVQAVAAKAGYAVEFFQSNHEGEIVDRVQAARGAASGIIINPAGLTTTSVALLDALLATELPVVEVHISNIHRREAFRHNSYVSTMAEAVIAGAGIHGYGYAAEILLEKLT